MNRLIFALSFFVLLLIPIHDSVFGEGCDYVIVLKDFGPDEIIEKFDPKNTEYDLRMLYYEKYFKNLSSSDILVLLPSERQVEERKEIMSKYGIHEEKSKNAEIEGIGTPEDILRYVSGSHPESGSASSYLYTEESLEKIDDWMEYWKPKSQNSEYVDKMYKILKNIITEDSIIRIIDRSSCFNNMESPDNSTDSNPIPPEEIVKSWVVASTPEKSELLKIQILGFSILAIISGIVAVSIFILYQKKKIFHD